MKTSTAGVVSLLIAFAFVAPAAATDAIGVVAVADPPGPTTELAELTHQLRVVAAERIPGIVDANELRDRMTGQTSSATFAELNRAYAGALATYQNGDFEGAVSTLRAVVQDLERLPASTEGFNQWKRAMLRLARAEQTLGRGTEARDLLDRLVRADPSVTADPNQYPPSFVKQVSEASAQVKALKKRKLAVATTARGAKVFVEGREVGTAPITLELPPGRYRLSGAHGNVHVPAIVVDLTEEGQSVTLNFALAEALRPGAGPGLALGEADRAHNLVVAGNWLRVDKLLAARFATESGVEYLSATFYDVRRGMPLREGRVRLTNKVAPAGALSALASFLVNGEGSDLVAQVQVEPSSAAGIGKEAATPLASGSTEQPPETKGRIRLLANVQFGVSKPGSRETGPGETVTFNGGAETTLGVGARYAIWPRVDLQLGVSVSYASTGSSLRDEFLSSLAGDLKADSPATVLTFALEGTCRVRPISRTFPWYVGVGPHLASRSYGGSIHYESPHVGIAVDRELGSATEVAGVVETGATFGAHDQWDAALRLMAGSADSTSVGVSLGWAFSDVGLGRK